MKILFVVATVYLIGATSYYMGVSAGKPPQIVLQMPESLNCATTQAAATQPVHALPTAFPITPLPRINTPSPLAEPEPVETAVPQEPEKESAESMLDADEKPINDPKTWAFKAAKRLAKYNRRYAWMAGRIHFYCGRI